MVLGSRNSWPEPGGGTLRALEGIGTLPWRAGRPHINPVPLGAEHLHVLCHLGRNVACFLWCVAKPHSHSGSRTCGLTSGGQKPEIKAWAGPCLSENLLQAPLHVRSSATVFGALRLVDASLWALPPSSRGVPVCVSVHMSPLHKDTGPIGLEPIPLQ